MYKNTKKPNIKMLGFHRVLVEDKGKNSNLELLIEDINKLISF
jgi:hypothetical protein